MGLRTVLLAHNTTRRTPGAGADYTLRSDAFGAKTVGQQDGVPPSASPYPFTTNAWALTIGGLTVQITYCRAAPGLIIGQFNFGYPTAVSQFRGQWRRLSRRRPVPRSCAL